MAGFAIAHGHTAVALAVAAASAAAASLVGIEDDKARLVFDLDVIEERTPQVRGAGGIEKNLLPPAFDDEIIHGLEFIEADEIVESRTVAAEDRHAQGGPGAVFPPTDLGEHLGGFFTQTHLWDFGLWISNFRLF